MKKISGKILENSSYTLGDQSINVYTEVRIQGDDGTIYGVRNATVDSRLNNALKPGNTGTFYFHRTLFRRNVLLAAEFNGVTEFGAGSPVKSIILGIVMIVWGIPSTLLLGLGLVLIAGGCSIISMSTNVIKLRSSLAGRGAHVQQFQTI